MCEVEKREGKKGVELSEKEREQKGRGERKEKRRKEGEKQGRGEAREGSSKGGE